MKTIFKAVATVTIFSVITRVLGFFFRIFISRKLGAEGMGLFQMASSVMGIFLTLVSSGIPLITAKSVSKYESLNQLKRRDKVVGSALIVAIVISLICSAIIFALKHFWNIILTDKRAVEVLIVLIPSILLSAIYAVFRGALWGQNDYFSCGLTELIEQIARFIFTIFLLYGVSDIFTQTKQSAIAFNIACLVSAIAVIIIFFKKNKISFGRGEFKEIITRSTPITLIRLSNSLVQPLTALIVPSMLVVAGYTSAEAVSSFGVIMGMTFPLLYVPMAVIGSISMVLIPSITSMLAKNDINSIEENVSQSLNVSMFLSMLFVPLFLSVGDLIGIVLYNNQMSGILLQFSAICVVPITLCNLTGSVLDALNLEGKAFINYCFGSVLLFIGLFALTPVLKINAVSISFFMCMGLTSILNIRTIKKAVPTLKFNLFKTSLKYTLMAIPSALLGHFVSGICEHVFTPFFSAVIGGGLSILFIIILCQIFKVYDLTNLLSIIKRKKKTS